MRRDEMKKEVSNFLECLCSELGKKLPNFDFIHNAMYNCIAAYKHIEPSQFVALYGKSDDKVGAIAVSMLCIVGSELRMTVYDDSVPDKENKYIFNMDDPKFHFDIIFDILRTTKFPSIPPDNENVCKSIKELIVLRRKNG